MIMYNNIETNKSILEKMANAFVKEDIKLEGLPRLVRSPYSNRSIVFCEDESGDVHEFNFIRNSNDATLTTLNDFASDNDIDDDVMENFNKDYGVIYNDKESLEDISFEITYSLKPYDEQKVHELIGKEDAFRALIYPDDYTIKSCGLIFKGKVLEVEFVNKEKFIYATILPSSTYRDYSAKEVSSLSKEYGINKANEIINKPDKYSLISEDGIRELDDYQDGDFETIADQLYGDYGMFDGYETFNRNDTNYVLVTKKAN